MSNKEIFEAIKILSEVVKANSGWLGNEKIAEKANDKIEKLMDLLSNQLN